MAGYHTRLIFVSQKGCKIHYLSLYQTTPMKSIKRLMVALDMTEMDRTLVHYAYFLGDILQLDNIDFIHVHEDLDEVNQQVLNELNLSISPEINFKDWVDELVAAQAIKLTQTSISQHLLQGSPLHEALRYARDQSVDMIMVGAKNHKDGTGILSSRLARKAPCSVMYVPEGIPLALQRIMLPTDFSKYSELAFEELRLFKEEYPDIEIIAQHVYRVPLGFYKTGKSYEEFSSIMEENSRKLFKNFIKEYHLEGLGLVPRFTLDDDKNPADKIIALAEAEQVDLMIICAKGHTRASSILLGSTTEKVLRLDKRIPVMVLKEKGETLNFLDILLNI